MPRNGSGSYSLPTNSWNPATNGVPATASDWQSLINDVASAITQSLSRDGQTPLIGNMPAGGNKLTGLGAGTAAGDSLRFEQLFSQGQPANIASAATTDIGSQLTTLLNVTGTTTITSFGVNYNGPRFLRFDDVLTLTHGASLVLPGAANITTAAGDSAIVVPLGTPATGWRVVAYQRAADAPGAVPDNSISTAKIKDDAVTFAKMQNVASGVVLGRSTADTGDVEALTTLPPVNGSALTNLNGANISSGDIAAARITNALNASGSAPIYACRAWVNFNGTGTVAIRASGNVSSITDNGTGNYTVNFTTAMPDANYSVSTNGGLTSAGQYTIHSTVNGTPTVSGCTVLGANVSATANSLIDLDYCNVSVFR